VLAPWGSGSTATPEAGRFLALLCGFVLRRFNSGNTEHPAGCLTKLEGQQCNWQWTPTMKHLTLILSLVMLSLPASAERDPKHLYLCRSPLLAFSFWGTLQNM
jgi:hypothetical protein